MLLSFTLPLYLPLCFACPYIQTPEPPNGCSWNLILQVSLKFVETFRFWLTSSNNNRQRTRIPARVSARIWVVTRQILTGVKNASNIGYREQLNRFYAHYTISENLNFFEINRREEGCLHCYSVCTFLIFFYPLCIEVSVLFSETLCHRRSHVVITFGLLDVISAPGAHEGQNWRLGVNKSEMMIERAGRRLAWAKDKKKKKRNSPSDVVTGCSVGIETM
jgi:hypothetical protein